MKPDVPDSLEGTLVFLIYFFKDFPASGLFSSLLVHTAPYCGSLLHMFQNRQTTYKIWFCNLTNFTKRNTGIKKSCFKRTKISLAVACWRGRINSFYAYLVETVSTAQREKLDFLVTQDLKDKTVYLERSVHLDELVNQE